MGITVLFLKKHIPLVQVYVSPWSPSFSDEQRHRHCLRRLCEWPRLSPERTYDDRMAILILAVLTFSPCDSWAGDRPLEDGAAVERVQQKYALLLYKYLRSVLGPEEGRARFGAGLERIALAREAYDMHSKMLPF